MERVELAPGPTEGVHLKLIMVKFQSLCFGGMGWGGAAEERSEQI
jgi:hypothetical protein